MSSISSTLSRVLVTTSVLVASGLLAACVAPVGDEPEATATAASALASVTSCGATTTTDVRNAMGVLVSEWATFEQKASDQGVSLGNCVQNRFNTGTVECASSNEHECLIGAIGYSSPLSSTIHICPEYVRELQTEFGEIRRQICLGALVAHEFTHSCWSDEGRAERVEAAAFNTLRSYYGVSINLADCGSN